MAKQACAFGGAHFPAFSDKRAFVRFRTCDRMRCDIYTTAEGACIYSVDRGPCSCAADILEVIEHLQTLGKPVSVTVYDTLGRTVLSLTASPIQNAPRDQDVELTP